MSKLHEECGVFGIYSPDVSGTIVSNVYHALYALQHRGQESCGIAINNNKLITCFKDIGLVGEVFTSEVLSKIPSGNIGVGHCRYGTTGAKNRENAQPILTNHLTGSMALCHNGNIINAHELRQELEQNGAIFHTTSDSEIITYLINQERLKTGSIETALPNAMLKLKGAYSLVIVTPTKLIALRDPNGFRPLSMGTLSDGSTLFASESCAFDTINASFVRDIKPGEIVSVDKNGIRSSFIPHKCKSSLCVFEFIYFARPDSVIDGSSVHTARLRAGAMLALEHPVQADVVIGVPDSGIDAAIGFSRQSGIPYGIGFIKNKYIGRTFIQPGQKERSNAVQIKLNVISSTIKDKRVVLIDDSIVRGTTSARIVNLLFEAGAKEVHVRLSSPPFMYPCYFGTDIDSRNNLIAANHTMQEICSIIGATSLGFLPVECLDKLADQSSCGFCKGCFTGKYPMEIPNLSSKDQFEAKPNLPKKEMEMC